MQSIMNFFKDNLSISYDEYDTAKGRIGLVVTVRPIYKPAGTFSSVQEETQDMAAPLPVELDKERMEHYIKKMLGDLIFGEVVNEIRQEASFSASELKEEVTEAVSASVLSKLENRICYMERSVTEEKQIRRVIRGDGKTTAKERLDFVLNCVYIR